MIENQEGYDACLSGRKLSDNPYTARTSGYYNWRAGWFYARWESTEE